MPKILTFKEAIKISKGTKYLLLGNGFSISLFPNLFSYSSLLLQANFKLNPKTKKVFDVIGTTDFERVIKTLKNAALLIPIYDKESNLSLLLKSEAEALKKILVDSITKNHPNNINLIEENKLKSCNLFLSKFNKIYTLNYDLLLYWTLVHGKSDNTQTIDDGFRNPDYEYGSDYRTFDSPHSPSFWYLHGGLHLFDAGSDLRKYVWSDTGKSILDQVKAALDKELYPLFVSEGTSLEKMTKISHSAYLSKALRSFEEICKKKGDLFIFGHSLADNDGHILSKICKGKISKLFVSLYMPESDESKEIIKKANKLSEERSSKFPLEVIFYDADTAYVWNSVDAK